MSTGLSSLAKLSEITAAYPFHGLEIAFALVILAFFVIFLIWQVSMETKHHEEIIGNFTASPDPASYEAEPVAPLAAAKA
jgi:hypothetical protein